jgi:excinuclease UvrABC nuclease subunit
MKERKHTLYRIYYRDAEGKDFIVYVGRTNMDLKDRLRGHFHQKPMHRTIDINGVSKIEYAEFQTEADMNLYEIYYILMLKPMLNVDDKTRDFPTVTLPEVEWHEWNDKIFDKWLRDDKTRMDEYERDKARYYELTERMRIVRSMLHVGEITEDESYYQMEMLQQEQQELRKKLYG